MSQPANTYLERKIAGLCTRCGAPAVTDRQLCQAHLEDARARVKRSNTERRRAHRRKKRCADCGEKAKRYRCRRCLSRVSGSANKLSAGENKREENWRVDPGTTWNRYRGKGRRGRLTREEQLDEDARDARWAIREIEKFIVEVGELKTPALLDLPAVQRAARRREAAQYLGTAGRFLDELADRYG